MLEIKTNTAIIEKEMKKKKKKKKDKTKTKEERIRGSEDSSSNAIFNHSQFGALL